MLRLIAIALLVCGFSAAAFARPHEASPNAPYHAAACMVQGQPEIGPDGKVLRPTGSGFYFQDGPVIGVLTAAHCVRSGNITVTFSDKSTAIGSATTCKYGHDVGFVFVTHPTIKPLTLSPKSPETGDRVEILGFGGPVAMSTGSPRHFYGEVIGFETVTEEDGALREHLKLEAPIMHGDSGGAIVNASGQVVGVQSFGDIESISQMVFATNGEQRPVFTTCGSAGFAPIRNFVGRLHNRFHQNYVGAVPGQCGPNGCPFPTQPRPAPAPQSPAPAPVQPPEYASPVTPIQPPNQPPCPEPQNCKVEIDYNLLAEVLVTKYPDVVRGPKGDKGDPGPAGIAGIAGQDAKVDLDELVKRLPPINVVFEAGQGEQPRKQEVALGGDLVIPPVKLEVQSPSGDVAFKAERLGKTIAITLIPK